MQGPNLVALCCVGIALTAVGAKEQGAVPARPSQAEPGEIIPASTAEAQALKEIEFSQHPLRNYQHVPLLDTSQCAKALGKPTKLNKVKCAVACSADEKCGSFQMLGGMCTQFATRLSMNADVTHYAKLSEKDVRLDQAAASLMLKPIYIPRKKPLSPALKAAQEAATAKDVKGPDGETHGPGDERLARQGIYSGKWADKTDIKERIVHPLKHYNAISDLASAGCGGHLRTLSGTAHRCASKCDAESSCQSFTHNRLTGRCDLVSTQLSFKRGLDYYEKAKDGLQKLSRETTAKLLAAYKTKQSPASTQVQDLGH